MKQSERLDICMAVALALILALACIPELKCKPKQVNLEIPLNGCLKKVKLLDCDMNANPPKCAKADVEWYPKSCPIIHLE